MSSPGDGVIGKAHAVNGSRMRRNMWNGSQSVWNPSVSPSFSHDARLSAGTYSATSKAGLRGKFSQLAHPCSSGVTAFHWLADVVNVA
ncbi:hypothetical protein [Pseudarthrobacter phenanthrenivorans]|uniref:hypothetical protein n=1 Tax=Pseudarthrobacter phenanthrenivorans TaxID=361575 RepID=UPI002F357DF6